MYLANPLLEARKQAFKSVVDLMKIHCLPTVAAKKKKKVICYMCLLSSELSKVTDPIMYPSVQVPSMFAKKVFLPVGLLQPLVSVVLGVVVHASHLVWVRAGCCLVVWPHDGTSL